jgi:hypothetical protein
MQKNANEIICDEVILLGISVMLTDQWVGRLSLPAHELRYAAGDRYTVLGKFVVRNPVQEAVHAQYSL